MLGKLLPPCFGASEGVDILITKKKKKISIANKMVCITGKIFLPPYVAEAVT